MNASLWNGSFKLTSSGMFVCSSFLISVCMFMVSKALLISSSTVIVRTGGAIWCTPILFNICDASLQKNTNFGNF